MSSQVSQTDNMESILCCVQVPPGFVEGDRFEVLVPNTTGSKVSVQVICPRLSSIANDDKTIKKSCRWIRVLANPAITRAEWKKASSVLVALEKGKVSRNSNNRNDDLIERSSTTSEVTQRGAISKRKCDLVMDLEEVTPTSPPLERNKRRKVRKMENKNKRCQVTIKSTSNYDVFDKNGYAKKGGSILTGMSAKVGTREQAEEGTIQPDLYKLHNVNRARAISRIQQILPPPFHNSPTVARNVGYFFLFCHERQLIWQRRNSDIEPWTTDPIMDRMFFCNVYRELDRGSAYFRSQILERLRGVKDTTSRLELTFWCSIVYRLLNRIQTFERFGGIPSCDQFDLFLRVLNKMKDNNEIIFTGAHMSLTLSKYVETVKLLVSNEGCYLKSLVEILDRKARIGGHDGVKGVFQIIRTLKNVGNFFAWQITCDLLESKVLYSCTEDDWAQLGPGAISGAHICFSEVSHDFSPLELAEILCEKQGFFFDALGVNFFQFLKRHISLKNIEHALCEFQKYMGQKAKLQSGGSLMGQRKFGPSKDLGSRSYMDEEKVCIGCECDEDAIVFCDTCLNAHCTDCRVGGIEDDCNIWICSLCSELENKIT